MNILVLCLSPGFGGLEFYAFRSACALAERNNVHAALNNKILRHFRKNCDIPITQIKRHSISLPFISAFKIAKYIDKHNIEIIHVHWVKDLAVAVLAKRFSTAKPVIVFTRHMMITRAKKDFYHRFIYRHVDLILTITQQLAEACIKMIGERNTGPVKALYPGVTAPAEILSPDTITAGRADLGLPVESFVVGFFGRLEYAKGPHLLIAAIEKAKNDGNILYALIIGEEFEAGYLDKLQTQASASDLSEQIIIHGFVPDPQAMMQLCDCVVLTTYEETFGLVLPEAMRAGIAVIGSNKGGVTEIIDDNISGLLFESGDAADLYRQIDRLYSDTDFRTKLALNGKNKADEVFDANKHFQQLEHSMASLLENKNK